MVHSKKEIITIIIKRNSKQAKYMDTWVLWHGNTVNKMVTVVKTRGQMRKTVWCHEQVCMHKHRNAHRHSSNKTSKALPMNGSLL